MVSKHLGINSLKETVMNAKLSDLSELAKKYLKTMPLEMCIKGRAIVWGGHVLMLRRDVSMHLTEEPRNRNAKLDTLIKCSITRTPKTNVLSAYSTIPIWQGSRWRRIADTKNPMPTNRCR